MVKQHMKKYNLSGQWKFCLDEGKNGITKSYFDEELEDTISLPGTTALAKKGTYNEAREIGFLTEEYPFSGYAWYQKTVTLPKEVLNKPVKLFLERTRVTKVWINDSYVGTYDSLCTPHEYDLSNYIKEDTFTITIMVSNSDYVTKGGHLTSPDTQTNWNGILGEIALYVYDDIYINKAKTETLLEEGKVKVTYEVINLSGVEKEVEVHFKGDKISLSEDDQMKRECGCLEPQSETIFLTDKVNKFAYTYTVNEPVLWSEYSPVYYELSMWLGDHEVDLTVPFGLRTFEAKGRYFYINGKKTFLRGKHDGMIFPLTGACPTDVNEWIRVMKISKSYGINHYRYHTCCPPENAFVAANLLGIYMEPELPFWGSLAAPGEEGYNKKEQDFLIAEGKRMMEAFGNHPSYCMMSLGNELWGSSKRMAEIIRYYKSLDTRHLYTEGSNNFQFTPVILEEDDYYVGVRFSRDRLIRGSYGMCDKPLGFVQTDAPNSVHTYDEQIIPPDRNSTEERKTEKDEIIEIQFGTGTKKVKAADSEELVPEKPVVSHEIGQYAVYPNFEEIKEYTGPLKARNFEVFRERLEEAGLGDLAKDYFECSGKLSVECYKLELEAAHRSDNLAGYQILDIQDFSGQGTALVGILDACMNSKGLVTPKRWKQFCSDAVIMAGFEEFSIESGKMIDSDIILSYYREQEIEERIACWSLCKNDEIIKQGQFEFAEVTTGVQTIGTARVSLPVVTTTAHYQFKVGIKGTDIVNEYDLILHPPIKSHDSAIRKALAELDEECKLTYNQNTIYITRTLKKTKERLMEGGRVLYLPRLLEEHSIEGQYCTDFWCFSMFKGISEWMKRPIPVGTMGVLNDNQHEALKDFTCMRHATPQWYHLVMNSRLAILDHTEKEYRPIVQMIDNFERNHKLGLLFEANVLNGTLMVCTSDLTKGMQYADVVQFTKSILSYMGSSHFTPSYTMDIKDLEMTVLGVEK